MVTLWIYPSLVKGEGHYILSSHICVSMSVRTRVCVHVPARACMHVGEGVHMHIQARTGPRLVVTLNRLTPFQPRRELANIFEGTCPNYR